MTPPECVAYEAVVQAVLDRERPPAALAADHTATCDACRDLAAGARLFLTADLTALPTPPADLTNRILASVDHDVRVRRKTRVAAGVMAAALAASVVVGVVVMTRGDSDTGLSQVAKAPAVQTAPPPRVSDQLAEAGSALASITSRVKDTAVTPTRTLFTVPDAVALDVFPPETDPAAESLAAMPQAAGAGLEPVAATTRRAVNVFLRDFGMSPPSKPNS